MTDDKRDTAELTPITLKENPYRGAVQAAYAAQDARRELKSLAEFFQALNSLPGLGDSAYKLAILEQGADLIASLSERLIEVVDDIRAGRVDPTLPF